MKPVLLPAWIAHYKIQNLRYDIIAGLTVAVMLVPQAMAYAMLAGLPPIIGLYASVLPLVVYALFGTSPVLAVGPVAMVSLLVGAGISPLAPIGSDTYIAYAILLALLIGIIQFVLGIARLGFMVNFISHPVISGFTSAAALIIGFSQLKHLLGIEIPRSHFIHTTILGALENLPQVNVPTLILGGLSIVILIVLKKRYPAFPAALSVVLLGIFSVIGFDLDSAGVKIVGNVPQGLPGLEMPLLEWGIIVELLPIAVAISLVSFMESIAIARAMAARYNHSVDANQELIGLGLANIAGSFFQSYPVTGGFSRTAVNAQAGARSALAAIITAVLVALTLLFLTSLLFYLPLVALASIIMVAVFGLIDFREFRHLLTVKRVDAAMLALTFLGTLVLGIEAGILLGVGVSLLLFIARTTRPHYAILGQLPGTFVYRNVKRFPDAKAIPEAAILRIDASFYFGNTDFLQDTIEELVSGIHPPGKAVIIDMSSVNYIDSSAAEALSRILKLLHEHGLELMLANLKGPVRDVIHRSGFYKLLGAHNCFFTIQDAVNSLLDLESKEHLYRSEESAGQNLTRKKY